MRIGRAGARHQSPCGCAAHAPSQLKAIPGNKMLWCRWCARPESSTRGRRPLAMPRPSHGPTSGRRLTSCCMRAGDLESYNEPIQPQLPKRPPEARSVCPFRCGHTDRHSAAPGPVASRKRFFSRLKILVWFYSLVFLPTSIVVQSYFFQTTPTASP